MITKEEAEKAYAGLIQLRRSEILEKDKANLGSIEIHHILPISCKGSDDEINKIALYAKEHFMAHVYLWIIHHNDEFHYQTMCALNQMIKGTVNGLRRELRDFILQSEEYQKAREEFAKYASETVGKKVSGKKNGMHGKCWIRNPKTKEFKVWAKIDQIPDGWEYGKYQPKTDKVIEQLKHFSQTAKGKRVIYNPITNRRKYIKLDDPIPDGFVFGNNKRTDKERKKISDTLKAQTINNPEFRAKKIEFLRPRYQVYIDFGFDEMKAQFNYPYSFPNFSVSCKTYLPEYVKHAREKGLPYKDLVLKLSFAH